MSYRMKRWRKIFRVPIPLFIAALILWRVLIPLVQFARRQSLPVPRLSKTGTALVSASGLHSDNAVLVRKSNGQILMDKNTDGFT